MTEQAQGAADAAVARVLEEPGFPWWLVVLILLVSSVLAWGTTEAIVQAGLGRWRMRAPGTGTAILKKRMWWTPLLWFLAVGIGALVGLIAGLAGDWKAVYCVGVGACGGGLAAFLVKLFKRSFERLADVAVGSVLRRVGLAPQPGEPRDDDGAGP